MDNRQYAAFKRIYEHYQADPDFRQYLTESPSDAVKLFGLPVEDGKDVSDAVRAILFGKADEFRDQLYVAEHLKRIKSVISYVSVMMDRKRYRSQAAADLTERNLERSRMESAVFKRNSQIRFVPIAFELSEGCKIRCPFCGLNAGEWKKDFSYTKNRNLWIEIIKETHDYLGDITDQSPLYFATEPLDHPDYEAFLKDEEILFKNFPQTTTAAAQRDIIRTKELMAYIGRKRLEAEGRLRFSIISLSQFKKIMKEFTAEELTGVELLINNPESVNAISSSGRVLKSGGYGDRVPVRYSISCLSGVKVNLCSRTMVFMEPVLPGKAHPEGILKRETVAFTDGGSFRQNLSYLFDKYSDALRYKEQVLSLNPALKVIPAEDKLILAGEGAGYALSNNLYTQQLVSRLKQTTKGIPQKELVDGLAYDERSEKELYSLLKILYQKGYIVSLLTSLFERRRKHELDTKGTGGAL